MYTQLLCDLNHNYLQCRLHKFGMQYNSPPTVANCTPVPQLHIAMFWWEILPEPVSSTLYLPSTPYGVKNDTLHCGHHKCHRECTCKTAQIEACRKAAIVAHVWPSLKRGWGFLMGGAKLHLKLEFKEAAGPSPIFGTFKV